MFYQFYQIFVNIGRTTFIRHIWEYANCSVSKLIFTLYPGNQDYHKLFIFNIIDLFHKQLIIKNEYF